MSLVPRIVCNLTHTGWVVMYSMSCVLFILCTSLATSDSVITKCLLVEIAVLLIGGGSEVWELIGKGS